MKDGFSWFYYIQPIKIDYKDKSTDLCVQVGIRNKRMRRDHDKLILGGRQHQRNHQYSCCSRHLTSHSHTHSCIHPECWGKCHHSDRSWASGHIRWHLQYRTDLIREHKTFMQLYRLKNTVFYLFFCHRLICSMCLECLEFIPVHSGLHWQL